MPRCKQPTISPDEVRSGKSYSVSQVAALLGYHPGHVRRLIREGRVAAFRPNGYELRILGEEVLRLLEGLAYNGGLLSKPEAPVNVIEVTPEEMRRMFPGWEPNLDAEGSTPSGAD